MKLASVTAVLALTLVAPSAAATGPVPTLRIAHLDPLLLRGRHFKPAERVRVVLDTSAFHMTRRTVAGPAGTFTVDFGNVRLGPCLRFGIRAIGSGGSQAVLAHRPLPACMPESSP